MALVSKEIQVPKELEEVLVLVRGLVADLKNKKPVAELAAGALPNLLSAVDGIDQLDDEWVAHQDAFLKAGALFGVEVVSALLAKDE
jgi:hypothetical protein